MPYPTLVKIGNFWNREKSGLELKKGWNRFFFFPKELPLGIRFGDWGYTMPGPVYNNIM